MEGTPATGKVVALSTDLTLHLSATTENSTTKDTTDTDGNYNEYDVTQRSGDIQFGALVGVGTDTGGKSLADFLNAVNDTPINWKIVFVSGTNRKLIIGVLCIMVLILVPAWYLMNYSDSFRVDRIQVWLNPEYDINDSGMQTYNARLALGSGGLWGKGLFAVGNFAALNYIPDDHTDFIFAIVCETFGFFGGGLMIGVFFAMIARMIVLSRRAEDSFGCYLILGVMSMMLFHIFENISMVIGLMPVTGIPLPFVSYGGSSYLPNAAGIGLVINVTMRSRAGVSTEPRPTIHPRSLIR